MYYDENAINVSLEALKNMTLSDKNACLIFVPEASSALVPRIRSALDHTNVNYAGGIFPSIIAHGKQKTQGFIAKTVPVVAPPIMLNLSTIDPSDKRIQPIQEYLTTITYDPLMMVFSSNSMEQLTLQNNLTNFLRDVFPKHTAYIGGCAGSATLNRIASIFDRTGTYDNAAILTVIDKPSRASAEVGWMPTGKPSVVSEVHENTTIIQKVNNLKASTWFMHEYNKLRSEQISEADISFALNLQVAFHSMSGGYIVRAVLGTTSDGGLILGGSIPEKTIITLMDTKPYLSSLYINKMIRSLKHQIESANDIFVVECVTRPIIMGEQFSEELQHIESQISHGEHVDMLGFVGLGEFGMVKRANQVDQLNVSIVLAASE